MALYENTDVFYCCFLTQNTFVYTTLI